MHIGKRLFFIKSLSSFVACIVLYTANINYTSTVLMLLIHHITFYCMQSAHFSRDVLLCDLSACVMCLKLDCVAERAFSVPGSKQCAGADDQHALSDDVLHCARSAADGGARRG